MSTHRGLTIGYHNIVSYKQYSSYINKDAWYNRCDVLVLSETLTSDAHEVHMKGYAVAFRTNASRGILCFVRNGLPFPNIEQVGEQSSVNMCLFSISIQGVTIFSGYSSPKCSYDLFLNSVEQLYQKSTRNDKIVFIGDFNINLKERPSDRPRKHFERYGLTSLLSTSTSTTNNNTHIDVVFGNMPRKQVEAGVYESYFSDHKPVYCILLDEEFQNTSKEETPSPSPAKPAITERKEKEKKNPPTPIAARTRGRKEDDQKPGTSKKTAAKPSTSSSAGPFDRPSSPRPPPIPPEDTIEISDEEDPFEGDEAARQLQIYLNNIDNAIHELLRSNTEPTEQAINHLIVIINDRTGFQMQNVSYFQHIRHYKRADHQDDIQILFAGDVNSIGHWKCIYYSANQRKLFVYDSL